MERLLRNVTTRQTIAKNAFWLFGAQTVNRALRFLLVFVAARTLGPGGYGSFSYALSAATVVFLIADWGIGTLVMREYSREEHRTAFLRTALAVKAILVVVFTVIGSIGWFWIADSAARPAYLILVGLMALTQLRDFFIYALRARQEMEREFVSIVIEGAMTLLVALGLLALWPSPTLLALGYIVGMLASLLVSAQLVPELRFPFLSWDGRKARELARAGAPLAIFGVVSSLLFSIDQVVLGHTRSPEEVGQYALAARIMLLTLVVPQTGVMAFFPYLVRIAGSRRSRTVTAYATAALLLGGIAVTGFVIVAAPVIIRLVGGPAFVATVPVLRHLAWVAVLVFPLTVLDYYLIAHGRQLANAVVTGLALVANVTLNLVLIPRFGVSGAVQATLLSQTVNLVLTGALAAMVMRKSEG